MSQGKEEGRSCWTREDGVDVKEEDVEDLLNENETDSPPPSDSPLPSPGKTNSPPSPSKTNPRVLQEKKEVVGGCPNTS